MFAYCGNNPVNHVDEEGKLAIAITELVASTLISAVVGGVIGAGLGYMNAKAAGEDPRIGAIWGGAAGFVTGGVTGAAGALVAGTTATAAATITATAVGTNFAAGYFFDVRGQAAQHQEKIESRQTTKEFKADIKSAVRSGMFSAVGTFLGTNLTAAGSMLEVAATGFSSGIWASGTPGIVDMITRYLKAGDK